MKINQLQTELKKMDEISHFELKNSNELYIFTSSGHIEALVQFLSSVVKLNFVAEFCTQTDESNKDAHPSESFVINVLLSNRKEGYLVFVRYQTKESLVSLQNTIYTSYLFEREIADLFGLRIINGKDLRPLVKHEGWPSNAFPLRKSYQYGKRLQLLNQTPDYVFKPLSGEGGYQIPVGPVHAGIIEPGHFRFSVMGEPIENLEIRLMYKHRGIEKIAENLNANDLNLLFERVAGESTVAYAAAYAQLIEKLTGFQPSDNIKSLRVILLELERIYNFLDDIAGICVDVAYSYPAKKFSFFSEQIHQLCERLSGSRFLRNALIPCGSAIAFTEQQKKDIKDTLGSIEKRLSAIIDITLDEVSFLDRVEHTGMVEKDIAKKLCITGVVGRASGISYDARLSFPYEAYKILKTKPNVQELGGVFERYLIKIDEIKDAFSFIYAALQQIGNDIGIQHQPIALAAGKEAAAIVETVKGELVVYGQTGKDNRFNRIYFKTPSFTNWEGLTQSVLGEIVPDFPLCNKSFNMSYSENDR